LPRLRNHTLILTRLDIFDGAVEVALGVLEALGVTVCVRARQVRVDEFDQPVEVFGRDLFFTRTLGHLLPVTLGGGKL